MMLKPCPFCGGKAEIITDEGYNTAGKLTPYIVVRCRKCGVRFPAQHFFHTNEDERADILQYLTERWNSREDTQ